VKSGNWGKEEDGERVGLKKMKRCVREMQYLNEGNPCLYREKGNSPKRPQPTFQQSSAALLQVPAAQPPEKNGFFEGPSLTLCPCTDRE